MSDQPRRRLRPAPTPRRVGEPNVLSNQAIPNVLSTQTSPVSAASAANAASAAIAPSAASAAAPSTSPARPGAVRPTVATDRPAAPAPDQAARRTIRVPSLSTIIFLGFLLFTAARFLGNLELGGADPTTAPQATSGPRPTLGSMPTVNSAPGKVVFGESVTQDGCKLVKSNTRFRLGIDVWWQAEMTRLVEGDETVVYVAFRDGDEVDRETIPPDSEVGEWSVLCGGRAVPGYRPGLYRVEIWDESETELLSSGEYTKFEVMAPVPTASPAIASPRTAAPS